MADVADTLAEWSSTTASNAPSGATTIGTGLDDNLREIQGVLVRGLSHKGSDIASAATTDIGAIEGLMHDITGTTTITGLGTVRAGIWKVLKFEGAIPVIHNASSNILPGASNITTADGDVAIVISEGSGNWRWLSYFRSSGGANLGPLIGAEVLTTSGEAVVISAAVPAWAKKITLSLEGVSSSGTSPWMIQIGDAGDYETTGYAGRAAAVTAGTSGGGTNGYHLQDAAVAANVAEGQVVLVLKDAANFTWSLQATICYVGGEVFVSAGTKSLSAALDRIRITTNGGSDTFDAGSIGILYE